MILPDSPGDSVIFTHFFRENYAKITDKLLNKPA